MCKNLSAYGLKWSETSDATAFVPFKSTMKAEFGDAFILAMDSWCGLREHIYKLPHWQVLSLVDEEEKVRAIIGIYREHGRSENEFWVGWFGVDPVLRGNGLGQIMLERVINDTKVMKGEYLCVYTEPDNFGAIRLYKRNGFVESGFVKDYKINQYGASENEVVLTLAL